MTAFESAFERYAEIVHRQHRLASRCETWRECRMQPCYSGRRINAWWLQEGAELDIERSTGERIG